MPPARRAPGTARPRGPRLTLLAVLLVLAVAWTGSARAQAVTPAVAPTQELVTLLRPHDAFSQPAAASAPLESVPARGPLTGARTVLPVLGARTDADGVRWLHVRLPGRPNGHAGWIRGRWTASSTTSWHIVVELAGRRVTVYRDGLPLRAFRAVIGHPSTPTPRGRFFVEEAIRLPATAVGAPFALALSARSNVLQEYAGGPGQIALHGRANIGGVLGTAASHGCVRLDNAVMRWLVLRIGPGVPVTVKL